MALKSSKHWKAARDLAKEAGVAERSGRLYALKFVRLGLADVAEVYPCHRYRYSEKAGKRNTVYLQRLDQAIDVFGFGQNISKA